MLQASASLVVYRTSAADLQQLLETLQAAVSTWVLVDNSAEEVDAAEHRRVATLAHGGIYVASPGNLGFGAGHNLALEHLRDAGFHETYHLIVNPDIAFDPATLERLAEILDQRSDVGWVMPQVRSEDGSVQPLCKLLPTPFDLFGRRFLPGILRELPVFPQTGYEMDGIEEVSSDSVPFLSGCFVFARRELLQKAAGFDARYFMYMEDVDLSRRFRAFGKLLYWPEVNVIHGHCRGSHHDLRLTWFHIRSAIRYFQRWGWFIDPTRKALNAQALRSLRSEIQVRHATKRTTETYPSTPANR